MRKDRPLYRVMILLLQAVEGRGSVWSIIDGTDVVKRRAGMVNGLPGGGTEERRCGDSGGGRVI